MLSVIRYNAPRFPSIDPTGSPMTEPLLEARQITSERDDRLLFESLDLTVRPGDLVRLEGPNGAGKTTLIRILAGLFPPTSGQVRWRGRSVSSNAECYHGDMLYLGHRAGIKGLLTPLENLRALEGARRGYDSARCLNALEQVGLAGFEDIPCKQLSAGQQRRVGLARLLLSDEPLWLLDEIFTAIDRDGVAALEALLVERVRMGGIVVMTTHHQFDVPGHRRVQLGRPTASTSVTGVAG